MWMMGCNDGSEFNMPSADSFNGGRKLRPLIPRPLPSSATNTNTCHGNRIHSTTDFFLLNQHMATVAEQSKRELMMNSTQQVAVSSRWNPTSEQLQTLEELYRRGTRTPSADQIQHITAQLRQYGKIEGKNVFYWFQNHKARERQKRRRQTAESDNHQPRHIEILERKETGANRTGYDEVEQTKNLVPSTNWSTLAEESVVSRQRAAKAAMAECGTDGWIQVEEGELQQRRGLVEKNGTWQMMQLSCPPHTHLITTTANTTRPTRSIGPTVTSTAVTTMDPKLFFISPYSSSEAINNGLLDPEDELCGESQTLELFPLRSSQAHDQKELTDLSVSAMDSNFTTPNYQFFEFLPLKN